MDILISRAGRAPFASAPFHGMKARRKLRGKMGFFRILHDQVRWEQWAIMVVFAAIIVLGIDWGLPDRRRMDLLLRDIHLTEQQIEDLHSLRETNTQLRETAEAEAARSLLRGDKVDLSRFARKSNALGTKYVEGESSGSILSESLRLAALRGFILGSSAADEIVVPQAIGRMNPKKLDLDPKSYEYGGAYLYPLGAVYFVLKSLGQLTATDNFIYYIEHPSNIARLYLAGRFMNLLALIGTFVVLVLFGTKLSGRSAGTMSLLAYACAPMILNQVVISKPHICAAFFSLLAVYLLALYAGNQKRAYLAGSILSAGWAAGSACFAAVIFVFYPILLFERRRAKRAIVDSVLVFLGIVALFLITNPYAIISYKRYLLRIVSYGSSETHGLLIFSMNKLIIYIREVFLRSYTFPVAAIGLPFVAAACFRGKGGTVRRLSIALLVLIVLIGSTVNYARASVFLGPFFCLFGGLALHRWVLRSSRIPRTVQACILVIVFVPGIFFSALFARDTIFDNGWYEPTARWVRTAHIGPQTTIGVFRVPSPVSMPPFPFLNSNLINMNKYGDDIPLPEYVILDNYSDEILDTWNRHAVRQRYVQSDTLGYRASYDWFMKFRLKNESRVAAFVFRRLDG